MDILLTNDDGIYAEGLWALHEALCREHAVTVVAPDRERTAVSHGITLHQPLRASRLAVNGHSQGYAVNGTPADCVKLGMLEILSRKPDIVVSGLNPGANVGVNINYSGTVAAAKEAALGGLPAIAASIEAGAPYAYETAAGFIARLVGTLALRGLPQGTFLNVNFPSVPWQEIAGVRISRHGLSLFKEYMEKRIDPRKQTYYWQGADMQTFEEDPNVDGAALRHRFISVTPIKCDMTDYDALNELRQWGIEVK
ncbi:MAG: 5'/3'-nucleotidase SurE [Hyphomicrobiales bacterium]